VSDILKPQASPIREIGAPPATLIHIGHRYVDEFKLEVTHYGENSVSHLIVPDVKELPPLAEGNRCWINLVGLHDEEQVEELCRRFGIHPLVIEDILNTGSMPKSDDLGTYIFTSIKLPAIEGNEVNERHVSVVMTGDTVITFSEEESPLFEPLHRRLQVGGSRIRLRGTDYFNWAVLDIIADTLLTVIDEVEDELEKIEDQITTGEELPNIVEVHGTRRQVARLYRIARPFRDIVQQFINSESLLMTENSGAYYRDLADHSLQAVELTEFLRDHSASLRELYYTTTSHRMNEVMKILAAISAIFLPLTFLAGLYGMNFDHMPELHWKWGYPLLLAIFVALGATLAGFFRKKNWL